MKLQHDFWNARNATAFATAVVMFSVYGGNSAWDALYNDGYISPTKNCSWNIYEKARFPSALKVIFTPLEREI